jgi:SM-20-related protein
VLNPKAFCDAEMRTTPYRWGTVRDGFDSPAAALTVTRDFPAEHLTLREAGPAAEKAYRMLSVPLADSGRALPAASLLTPVWQELIAELLTPGFTAAVAHASRSALQRSTVEIRACGYADGCYLGPHTDRADKLASVILYLEPEWSPPEGGWLSILRSSDPGDEAGRVAPLLGSAAILVRSECSWHQVLPVRRPRSGYRRSVLVHYWA